MRSNPAQCAPRVARHSFETFPTLLADSSGRSSVGGFDPLEIARTVAQQMAAAAAQKAIAAGSERASLFIAQIL